MAHKSESVNRSIKAMTDLSHLWRVNTPGLFKELANYNHLGPATTGLNILHQILGEVAQRAIALNDKELNKLMLRLSLYSVADPSSSDFDQESVSAYLES